MESQAFGQYHARGDPSATPAQPSGATSDTPGQIAGAHLDAATPAGHAMQQASHGDQAGAAMPEDRDGIKAIVSDWIDKTFLPAINSQVHLVIKQNSYVPEMVCFMPDASFALDNDTNLLAVSRSQPSTLACTAVW